MRGDCEGEPGYGRKPISKTREARKRAQRQPHKGIRERGDMLQDGTRKRNDTSGLNALKRTRSAGALTRPQRSVHDRGRVGFNVGCSNQVLQKHYHIVNRIVLNAVLIHEEWRLRAYRGSSKSTSPRTESQPNNRLQRSPRRRAREVPHLEQLLGHVVYLHDNQILFHDRAVFSCVRARTIPAKTKRGTNDWNTVCRGA